MSARPATLTPWARGGLAALCVLLAASVLVRTYAYRQGSEDGAAARDAPGGGVDLGRGVLLPRDAAKPLAISVASCSVPVSVSFVRARPEAPDPSLVGRPEPAGRIVYVYRGWDLGSRFVTLSLNAIYVARAVYARMTMGALPATDDLALRIVVPPGCEASPEQVMSVLRSTRPPPAPPIGRG